jgi:hypothetical protein
MANDGNLAGIVIENDFSSHLLNQVVNSINEVQRGYIINHGLGCLLTINSFDVPLGLFQWIIQHTHVPSMTFNHKNKVLQFCASMVSHVIGFPSGNIPVTSVLSENSSICMSTSFKSLKEKYLCDGITTRKALINVLVDNNDEVSFIQQFVMLSIATVLCPGLQDSINLNYLSCVADISKINSLDWNSHVLDYLGSEMLKFQAYLDSYNGGFPSRKFNVCGCAALLPVSNFL